VRRAEASTLRRGGLAPGSLRDLLLLLAATLVLTAGHALAVVPWLRPELGALLVVYLALERSLMSGLALTLAVAYVADVLSGEARGLTTGALVLVFLVLRLLVMRVLGSSVAMVTSLAVLATALVMVFRFGIEALLGPGLSSWSAAAPALPASLVSAVLLGYPIHRLLAALDERARPREAPPLLGSRRR
jgi:hypothetical protein